MFNPFVIIIIMQYSIVASDLGLFPEGFQADNFNLENRKRPSVNEPFSSILNAEGILSYYRKFVNNFLSHLNDEDLDNEFELINFKVKILLTKHQAERLRLFSQSSDIEASDLIQETTDILNNMIQIIKPKINQSVANIIEEFVIRSRLQITVFALTVSIMTGVFYRHKLCSYLLRI